MCGAARDASIHAMTTTDYLIDSTLVLLVLLQIKDRPLTTRALVLVGAFALLGGVIGVSSGQTVLMHRGADGVVHARAGWLSGFFWVLGMGSRFAFLVWISHGGAATLAHFSATHSITGSEAWTVALLAMAVCEVGGRSLLMAARRRRVAGELAVALA
jgi:hypothetical protein